MKSKGLFAISIVSIAALVLSISSCGTDEKDESSQDKLGTLEFVANGEDFARNGFVSEDGWNISFDHVYATIYGPTAYQVPEEEQSNPAPVLMHAGHPHAEIPEGSAHVALTGYYIVDLAQGTEPAPLGELDAKIGNYNRVNFELKPVDGSAGDAHYVACTKEDFANYTDYSLVFIGTATKDDQTINFTIKITKDIIFSDCGPNGTAGVVAEGGRGIAEITFHFDHIFGDANAGPADTDDPESVNYMAVGFDYFARFAQDGTLDITDTELGEQLSGTEFMKFIDVLYTIGHSGEAHCHHS